MKKTAIIGFGCAGYSAARAIREVDAECQIDIYSDTGEAPYNPMLTTYYVSGKIKEEEMFPFGTLEEVAEELSANIFCACPVERLNGTERKIFLSDGTWCQYDDIIIATGAGAVIPPIKDLPDHGIYKMRTAQDARRMVEGLSDDIKDVLVVGAQMVGIKVVELLLKRGIHTYLADMETRMFPTSAYETTAAKISQRLTDAGVDLRFGSAVTSIKSMPDGRLFSELSDGSTLESDMVAFCSGIRPNIAFIDRDEIPVGRAIQTDLSMRTGVEHIYAAGDCCETADQLTGENIYIGLWANATLQGRVAGHNIVGLNEHYSGNVIQNITHYMDTDFISVGNIKVPGEHYAWESPDGWSVEFVMEDGKMLSLNILDNANLSGPVKTALLYQAAHPEAGMNPATKMLLSRSGIPERFIDEMGGVTLE